MKKIIVKIFVSMLIFSSLYGQQYTYSLVVPVDIDPIPENKIVNNGHTYNIRYYRFHFYVKNGNHVEKYIDLKAVPVSNSGLKKTFIVKKTLDYKLEGTQYGVTLQFCEDDRGNSCTYPISSDIKSKKYKDTGIFTKVN